MAIFGWQKKFKHTLFVKWSVVVFGLCLGEGQDGWPEEHDLIVRVGDDQHHSLHRSQLHSGTKWLRVITSKNTIFYCKNNGTPSPTKLSAVLRSLSVSRRLRALATDPALVVNRLMKKKFYLSQTKTKLKVQLFFFVQRRLSQILQQKSVQHSFDWG